MFESVALFSVHNTAFQNVTQKNSSIFGLRHIKVCPVTALSLLCRHLCRVNHSISNTETFAYGILYRLRNAVVVFKQYVVGLPLFFGKKTVVKKLPSFTTVRMGFSVFIVGYAKFGTVVYHHVVGNVAFILGHANIIHQCWATLFFILKCAPHESLIYNNLFFSRKRLLEFHCVDRRLIYRSSANHICFSFIIVMNITVRTVYFLYSQCKSYSKVMANCRCEPFILLFRIITITA